MCVIGLFTHFLFVQGFSVIFDFVRLTKFFSSLLEEYLVPSIPIDAINDIMLMVNPSFNLITPTKIAEFFVYQIVQFIVIGFTLPLRSITWTLWYQALVEDKENKTNIRKTKKA